MKRSYVHGAVRSVRSRRSAAVWHVACLRSFHDNMRRRYAVRGASAYAMNVPSARELPVRRRINVTMSPFISPALLFLSSFLLLLSPLSSCLLILIFSFFLCFFSPRYVAFILLR